MKSPDPEIGAFFKLKFFNLSFPTTDFNNAERPDLCVLKFNELL